MARLLGTSSPRLMCRKVTNKKAKAGITGTILPLISSAVSGRPSGLQGRLDARLDRPLDDEAQAEARQRDAELRGGEVGVEVVEQLAGDLGRPVPLPASSSIWLVRTLTSANSAATKNALASKRPATIRISTMPIPVGCRLGWPRAGAVSARPGARLPPRRRPARSASEPGD